MTPADTRAISAVGNVRHAACMLIMPKLMLVMKKPPAKLEVL